MANVPVLPLCSPLHRDTDDLLRHLADAWRRETGIEVTPVTSEQSTREPVQFLLILTGGTEGDALAFARDARRPVVLLSHSGHNSLPAALEVAARLRQDGERVQLVHLGANASLLPSLAQAAALARGLQGKRVGLVGDPSPWLVASSPDPSLLREKLGLALIPYPLDSVLSRVPKADPPGVEGPGQGIGEAERRMGSRVLTALSRLVEDEGLHALSVACFGLLPHGMTACWALASLSDAGVPGGCEGDLPALVALMVAQELTEGPGFLANPADVDLKGATVTLAHCTVPLALTRSHTLRTHFESGIGLAVAGSMKPGPYTLVRFGGCRLEQGFFVEGTVLPEPVGREDLCRTQLRFKMPRGAIERLLREPLGNHHVLVPGHHRGVLTEFHTLFLA